MQRIACLLLAAVLLLPGLAEAAEWGVLVAPVNRLNVRSAPSLNANKVTTLQPGEVVRADFLTDGWYAVFDPQVVQRDLAWAMGYCKASLLRPVADSVGAGTEPGVEVVVTTETATEAAAEAATEAGTEMSVEAGAEAGPGVEVVVTTETASETTTEVGTEIAEWGVLATPTNRLRVRSAPSLDADKVTTLNPGEVVRADFLTDGWYAVFDPQVAERDLGRAMGYCKASYLRPVVDQAEAEAAAAPETATEAEPGVEVVVTTETAAETTTEVGDETAEWGVLMAPVNRLNVRSGPSIKTDKIATLKPGEVVRADFLVDGWYAVFDPQVTQRDLGWAIGYCKASLLKPVAAQAEAETGVAPEAATDAGTGMSVESGTEAEPGVEVVVTTETATEPEPATGIDVASGSGEWGVLMAPVNRLNVRSAPSLDANKVTTLNPGEVVRADFLTDGWYAVFDPQVTQRDLGLAMGYCKASYLSSVADQAGTGVDVAAAPGEWGVLMAPVTRLNVRSGPSIKTDKVAILNPGEVVRADFLANGWYAVFDPQVAERDLGLAMGYCKASLLNSVADQAEAAPEAEAEAGTVKVVVTSETAAEPATEPEAEPEAEVETGEWGVLMAPVTRLNVRSGPSIKTDKVATLNSGEVVRADFLANGWYAVFDPQVTQRDLGLAMGYCKASLLNPVAEQTEAETGTAPGAETEAGTVKVVVTSETAAEPATEPEAEPEAEVETGEWGVLMTPTNRLNVRSGPSLDAGKIKLLEPGEVIRADFLVDGWYAVFDPQLVERDLDQAMGYCKASYLRSVDELVGEAGWGRVMLVTAPILNVRTGRGLDYQQVMILYEGDLIRVDFAEGDWAAVFHMDATEHTEAAAIGYTDLRYLKEPGLAQLAELSGQIPAGPSPSVAEAEQAAPVVVEESFPASTEEVAVWDEDVQPERSPDVQPQAPAETRDQVAATATDSFVSVADEAPVEYEITVPQFVEGEQQGREPVADKEAHGFRYAILDVSGTQPFVETMSIEVYLDVTVVPGADSLRDFASTVWKIEGRSDRTVVVDIFLPGQNLRNLSYATATFDPDGLVEFWTRETTLYGTSFK